MTEQQEDTLNRLLGMVQDLDHSAASDGGNNCHPSVKTESLYETLAMALREALTASDEGMTLRDHFAGLAMQGLLAGGPDALARSNKKLVPFSYEIADAMIAERSKAQPEAVAIPKEQVNIKLTEAQHTMFKALGGSPWLQGLLNLEIRRAAGDFPFGSNS